MIYVKAGLPEFQKIHPLVAGNFWDRPACALGQSVYHTGMLIDEAVIHVAAGHGGAGIASFRREKYIPKGGPDGGDGGRGGDVIFVVGRETHALAEFASKKEFKAENGQSGQGKQKTGRGGKSLRVTVPPGTLIFEQTETGEQLLIDLTERQKTYVVAKGGKGGLGNIHFKSSTNQAPRECTPGAPGEARKLRLELRLIADVGIIGLPNAGKSTLLARVSAARPKIADYPFTTLEPNLGVVSGDGYRFVLADIPGLVAGAAKGKGLGIAFLKHILRTRILVHLIAADTADPLAAYTTVRKELKAYGQQIDELPEIVVISKVELFSDKEQRRLWQAFQKHDPIFLSAATGRGVNDLVYAIAQQLTKLDAASPEPEPSTELL